MEELDLHWTSADPDLGIPSEGVLCKDMKDIIARISQVKDTVKKINLNNQSALTEVPKIIGECTLLEELNISHTGIKEVPDFIFTLPNLHFLSCRCMELMYFPADLSKAEKLEKLHFRINNGASFPKEMLSLKNLKRIAVDLYSDAAFPENLGTLKKLEKLNLFIKFNYSEIPRLPDSFKNHPAFKNLNIHDPFRRNYSKFNLSHASNILSSCPSFESLKLSNIDVGNGYLDMALLLGLKELELRQLLIDGNIFDAISHLPNLEMLQILGSSFKITEIPDMFANMKKLREFSFAGNMIKELPPSIYTLGNLTTLEIGSTGISALDEKIANLKNLETLQIYDNVLSRLPDGVFTLPKLKILNVEENIIAKNDLIAINGKIKEHEKNGQKIEFVYSGQGHRLMVKRLRTLKNVNKMDTAVYVKHCVNAIKENPVSVKYIDAKKLKGTKYYIELCLLAVKKSPQAIENIDPAIMGDQVYFRFCMEAVRNPDVANMIRLIKGDTLTDSEYIQICMEAALHNKKPGFLENFNTDAFKKRFTRNIYEHICWIAIMHYPPVIDKMENPSNEFLIIASDAGHTHKK